MDKRLLQTYSVWAKENLEKQVEVSLKTLGINGDNDIKNAKKVGDYTVIDGDSNSYPADLLNKRSSIVSMVTEKGYKNVIEEFAYTWFNRFVALRFMEVHDFLPHGFRVLSNRSGGIEPEILRNLSLVKAELSLDMNYCASLKEQGKTEELFRYVLLHQCNALADILPKLFNRENDYLELLLPKSLLIGETVLTRLIEIPEENFLSDVQIIGWLYQYYNSAKKDKVFENLKKNIKISKENIPAATQLFTPDWIVRYMVENSLGRLWVEGHPNDELKANWKYYLEEAEQEPDVQKQLAEIRKEYAALKPEEIKVIDPCMGSGHILVYMFDVLVQIYEAYGYNTREAAGLILQNNIYGLDIDDRAAQLAYFAVMMKARQYDRRIFSRGIQPHVYAIVESNGISRDVIDYFEDGRADLKKALETILAELHDAKEYGSILNVTQVDFAALYARLEEIENQPQIRQEDDTVFGQLKPLIEVSEAMVQKYHAVVTNPPYMGSSGMSAKLSEFVKKNYPDSKSDLFAVFIDRCGEMCGQNGYQAMITQHAWMFLSSFEKLREKLLQRETVNMAHLGARAFEEIGGEVVQTTSFVLLNNHILGYKGLYCRLIEPTTQQGKEDLFLTGEKRYTAKQDNFSKIPGAPVAYWMSQIVFNNFEKTAGAGSYMEFKKGMSTGDNSRFIRLWYEVNRNREIFDCRPNSENDKNFRWYPINSGGGFRKWYGNNYYVANWENDGKEMKDNATILNNGGHWSRYIVNTDKFFYPGITWNAISSAEFGARYFGYGYLFSSASMCGFGHDETYILGLLNSNVTKMLLGVLAPTLNFGAEQIRKIPCSFESKSNVENIVTTCLELSCFDWDSFETSWDFKKHPLI